MIHLSSEYIILLKLNDKYCELIMFTNHRYITYDSTLMYTTLYTYYIDTYM